MGISYSYKSDEIATKPMVSRNDVVFIILNYIIPLKIWINKKLCIHLHHQKLGAPCGVIILACVDPVAQQVEHNTFNVGVPGSSPGGITNNQCKMKRIPDNQTVIRDFYFIPIHFSPRI